MALGLPQALSFHYAESCIALEKNLSDQKMFQFLTLKNSCHMILSLKVLTFGDRHHRFKSGPYISHWPYNMLCSVDLLTLISCI